MDKFLVLDEYVTVKWSTRTKTHYEERGYKYTAMGREFRVKVTDLPEKSKMKVLVRCPECGVARRVAWQSIADKDNTYCQKCASKVANFEDLTGQKFGRLSVLGLSDKRGSRGQYYYDCLCDCGERTTVEGTSLSSGATRSCGCLQREVSSARMSALTGELNPMWDSTKTDEDRHSGHSDAGHRAWREKVFAKDGNKCVCCGATDSLHAHHIMPYAEYIELREDVDNGTTLCEDCHSRFHANYGVSGVTDVELKYFLEGCN